MRSTWRERSYRYFFVFVAVLGASCSSDDSSGRRVESTPDSTAFIGSDGGVVRSPDGLATVEVAAGASTVEFELGIAVAEDAPPGSLGRAYSVAIQGVTKVPFTIRLSFAGQLGINAPSTLRVGRVVDGAWVDVAGSRVDLKGQTVSAGSSSSGSYGVLGCAECNEGTGGSGGSGVVISGGAGGTGGAPGGTGIGG